MKKNYENVIQIFKIIKNDKNKIKINVKNKNKTFQKKFEKRVTSLNFIKINLNKKVKINVQFKRDI